MNNAVTKPVVVRFAPSPTGCLHIGGVRTALYNYLMAKQTGGRFILRIEDTDATREVPGADQYIIDSLKWCGITFDEGYGIGGDAAPYRQSERKTIYHGYAQDLIRLGAAYYAFDTAEETAAMNARDEKYTHATRMSMRNSLSLPKDISDALLNSGAPFVIRQKIEPGKTVVVNDVIRGTPSYDTTLLNDQVLMKSDGMPTYHFANVVDDHEMEITHVLRGEEWLNSTPLHVLLYDAFGWDKPTFAHLPLILKPLVNTIKVNSSGKLSKRDGAIFGIPVVPTEWYGADGHYPGFDTEGYFPDVLLNFLAILSWSPGNNEEIMTLDRMIETFDISKVSKAGARFNIDKLNFFNKMKIKNMPVSDLIPFVRKYLPDGLSAEFTTDKHLASVIMAMRERVTTLKDFAPLAPFLFCDEMVYDAVMVDKHHVRAREIAATVYDKIVGIDSTQWNDEVLKNAIESIEDFSNKTYMAALRMITTGCTSGPHVYEVMGAMGKPITLNRLKKFM